MKFSIHLLPLAALATVFAFSSCKREKIEPDTELQTSIDNSVASSEFSSISNLFDTEARSNSDVNGKTGGTTGFYCPGATVTVTNVTSNSAHMEIDFGTGSTCLDGRTRTGKLKADFFGKWKDSGSDVDITTENYTVNGFPTSFNMNINMNAPNGNGNLNWDVEVTNGSIITPDGTITYESIRNTEWTAGQGDLDPSNDEFMITGAATGTARTGKAFSMSIDEPLHIKTSCTYIVAGKLSLTPAGLNTRTIDYGTGTCDNQAQFTLGSYTTPITLP